MQVARVVVAVSAVGLALACEAFIDDAWAPPPCCSISCPKTALGAVLVAPNGVVDGGPCGTPEAPCGRVGAALARLDGGQNVVAIATGTYQETIDLHNIGGAVFLCGGYEPGTWSRGDASSSIIGTDTVAVNDPSSGPSCLVLDRLDIASKAQAAPDETLVGVYAFRVAPSADLLCTRGVTVRVASGGDGLDGDAGADGVVIACAGDAGADAANGTNGDSGAPALAGYFDSTGTFIPGDGQNGARGGDGLAGAYNARTCDECSYCVDNGDGTWTAVGDAGMCSAGTSGCGGGGGGAGSGGRGGGASAAMVVVKLRVAMSNTTLSAQAGGRGGRGAPGGVGASGSAGTSGFCWACNINGVLFDATANGGEHDDGGSGGKGGNGANGAGGWSCAIVVDDVAQDGGLDGAVLQFAEAGAGDPSGQAAAICHTN